MLLYPLGWLWARAHDLVADPVLAVALVVIALWTPARLAMRPLRATLKQSSQEARGVAPVVRFQSLDQLGKDLQQQRGPSTTERALRAGLGLVVLAAALVAIQAAFVVLCWYPDSAIPAGSLRDAMCATSSCAPPTLPWSDADLLAPVRTASASVWLGLAALWAARIGLVLDAARRNGSSASGSVGFALFVAALQAAVFPLAGALFVEISFLWTQLLDRVLGLQSQQPS